VWVQGKFLRMEKCNRPRREGNHFLRLRRTETECSCDPGYIHDVTGDLGSFVVSCVVRTGHSLEHLDTESVFFCFNSETPKDPKSC